MVLIHKKKLKHIKWLLFFLCEHRQRKTKQPLMLFWTFLNTCMITYRERMMKL